ncbi:hypothetical protein P8C59_007746 [Phyllachora maydis]|uniref:Uncharacterized protein n=1 Tax=Phyllachora maydis TaxID=1825666 RepID=A0AAD9I936_9PEZI|nr:hypothetical protein P8C59_007746 [Phyllachora maydis]
MADQAKGKASIKDSVSAIKNISSTLASLTNSSNTTATRKTSYSPRFDPFSGTIDLDSPSRPPRKEPYLGPAIDNIATSNLDPPIDTGSKEGFKDTITSSIVKELSKKAYTIPDDKTPDISNTYSDSNQAVLLMLLCNSLSSSPRAAISWIYIPSKAFKLLVRQYSRPIESKKEDVYNEFHALTLSTYRKGLSAFNTEFNGYLAKLTIAKIYIYCIPPIDSSRVSGGSGSSSSSSSSSSGGKPTNNTALEGELVDLDLDLEGAVSPDPSNLNTKKPISIEIGPSKLEPYKSSSDNDCLFIGPNIGYITDLKKQLNKVYAIEDLGPAPFPRLNFN